jgi:hypothetical protein
MNTFNALKACDFSHLAAARVAQGFGEIDRFLYSIKTYA